MRFGTVCKPRQSIDSFHPRRSTNGRKRESNNDLQSAQWGLQFAQCPTIFFAINSNPHRGATLRPSSRIGHSNKDQVDRERQARSPTAATIRYAHTVPIDGFWIANRSNCISEKHRWRQEQTDMDCSRESPPKFDDLTNFSIRLAEDAPTDFKRTHLFMPLRRNVGETATKRCA